jgi:hypothetical protein
MEKQITYPFIHSPFQITTVARTCVDFLLLATKQCHLSFLSSYQSSSWIPNPSPHSFKASTAVKKNMPHHSWPFERLRSSSSNMGQRLHAETFGILQAWYNYTIYIWVDCLVGISMSWISLGGWWDWLVRWAGSCGAWLQIFCFVIWS